MGKEQHSRNGVKTAVFINNSSNGGKGADKWLKINQTIKNQLHPETLYIDFTPPCNLKLIVKQLFQKDNVRFFIAAGGDGTVHHLINDIAEIDQTWLSEVHIGAIGLGSSNDFHKPCRSMIKGIPVRIDLNKDEKKDIGLVKIESQAGAIQRFFCINAGIGFTAEGNACYNNGGRFMHILKRNSTTLSIIWAVVKTLTGFKNIPVTLTESEKTSNMLVTNISICKNPNISGNFRYDLDTPADSGKFGLYIAEEMSKPEIIMLLHNLYFHRFSGVKKCSTSFTAKIEVTSYSEIAVETDGEIHRGNHFTFTVFPEKILFAG